MGGFNLPQLPAPPQIETPRVPMSGGGMVGGAPGQLPYKQNPAVSAMQGIGAFIEGFTKQREAEKEKALQRFMLGIKMMQSGIPGVDLKKLAKDAQAADLPLDLTGSMPQQAPAQPMGGQPQAQSAGSPGPAAPPPQQSIPSEQPGPGKMMSAFNALIGRQPEINPNSPGMYALQGLQARAQSGINLAQMQQINEQQKQVILGKAMKGDFSAIEQASRLKLMDTLGPRDELTMILRKAGMTEEQIGKLYADDLAGGPQLRIQMEKNKFDLEKLGWEKHQQALNMGFEYQKNFPGMPWDIAYGYAVAHITGDQSLKQQLTPLVQKFKPKALLDMEMEQQRIGIAQGNLDVSRQNTALRRQEFAFNQHKWAIDNQNEVGKALLTSINKDFDNIMQRVRDKNTSDEERVELTKMLAESLNARNDLKFKDPNGKDISVPGGKVKAETLKYFFGMFDGDTILKFDDPKFEKKADPVGAVLLNWLMEEDARYLNGQADNATWLMKYFDKINARTQAGNGLNDK